MAFRHSFASIARRARASFGHAEPNGVQRAEAVIAAPAPVPPPAAPPPAPSAPSLELLNGGVSDAIESGWFNGVTGELLTGFPIGADDIVLDFGCGETPLTQFVAAIPSELILVDTDAAKLEAAQAHIAPKQPRKVRPLVVQGGALPLPDASVTRVVATEVLEHVEDPEFELRELMRVARPGSLFLVSVPHALSENAQRPFVAPDYFERPNHIRVFTSESFRSLIEGAGLQIERSFVGGFYWSVWWCFFWTCGVDLMKPAHPLLEHWAHTWALLLKNPGGDRVKKALDECLPKTQVVIARKP
jgi:SAM-dependent methyltransferase